LSRLIGREEVIAGHATDLNWLKNRGLVEHTGRGILSWWPRWDTAWGLCWPFRTAWNSVNASCWRDDLLEVNGFDERIQCGALDRELGERLYNAGVRGKNVRLRALCVRLASRVPSLPRQTLERNLALSGQTRRTRAVWTPFGIRKGFRVLGVEKETSPATKSEPRRRAVA
jgi:hypothetical protein